MNFQAYLTKPSFVPLLYFTVGHAAGLTIQNAVLNSVKIAAWAANTPVNFRGTLKFIGSAPIELSGIVATINSTAIAWETPLLFSDTYGKLGTITGAFFPLS
jgi:hypothetical protein